MNTPRSSREVVDSLLHSMTQTVNSYHHKVTRTPIIAADLIAGTACFPGGMGLWRGEQNGGSLPEMFPHRPVMFVGHNFDSQRAFEASVVNKGEAGGQFWQRLLAILKAASLSPSECFFTNALMGLKPGRSTGSMPSVPGYREQCFQYLQEQVLIVRPRAVIALGINAEKYVSRLPGSWTVIRHPSDWHFRELLTREARLQEEGEKILTFFSKANAKQQINTSATTDRSAPPRP